MPGRQGGIAGPLLLLLLLLFVAFQLAKGLGRALAPGPGWSELSQEERQRLAVQSRMHAGHGRIEVVRSGAQMDSRSLLAEQRLGSGYYLFDIAGESRATASALGVDREHHIVNAYMVGILPFEVDNPWLALMTLAQRKRYQFDHLQYWGTQDVWQTSAQAMVMSRGDCEDHALALADWLISLGEDARVVVGEYRGGGHAWVVLLKDGNSYLFEATQKQGLSSQRRLPLASLLPDYRPYHMFNREYFWTNTGTSYTTDYRSAAWVRKSRYWPEGG